MNITEKVAGLPDIQNVPITEDLLIQLVGGEVVTVRRMP